LQKPKKGELQLPIYRADKKTALKIAILNITWMDMSWRRPSSFWIGQGAPPALIKGP
jgi:hypothetical protein